MKKLLAFALVASSLLLGGCASPPQPPLTLSSTALPSPGARIGVAMSPLPKVDTSFPGASCLLCMAAASVANSSLTTHTQTLPSDDVARLKGEVAALLRKKGQNVTVIDEAIKTSDLPKLDGGPNKSPRDFSALRAKYQVDKLLVIEVGELGITRSYATYIPSGDPQGVVAGTAYLVNLADNSYEWYLPIRQVKSAAGKWDEAPKFPGLSNAYFQAVEGARDAILQPFAN
jgi:hypothetical protein